MKLKKYIIDCLFLFVREFGIFWKNNVVKVIFIGGPLIYGILFGYIYQKGKVTNLPIIVVDIDQSPTSAKIIDMLDENEVINVVRIKHEETDLKQEMLKYNADAIVVIPENFEADILQKRTPEVNVKMNTANILTANFASKALQSVFLTLNAGVQMEGLKKQGLNPAIAAQLYEPFKVNYIKYYNKASNYMYFLWPGMLATILQQVLLIALALSFAREFEHNTFLTEYMPRAHNMVTAILIKCLPYWILSVGIWAMYGFMFNYFKLPMPNHLAALNFLGLLLVVSVSFLGILASILLPTQLSATDVLMVIATPSFVISGFTWPLSQMPELVQKIANCIPLTHFLEGFRKIYMLDVGLSDVQPQVKVLSYMIIVFFVLSIVALYVKTWRMKRRVIKQNLNISQLQTTEQ